MEIKEILVDGDEYTKELESSIHKTIKKVSEDFETLKFNTGIAALMALLNEFNSHGSITKRDFETFLVLLNPVAPHITEELWELIGLEGNLYNTIWPKFDEEKTKDDVIEMPIQISGKVRGKVVVNVTDTQDIVREKALADESISKFIGDKKIVKEIFVMGKIYNIVVK